jgi:integrase
MTYQKEIQKYLDGKKLSENSIAAYRYDLQQFDEFLDGRKLSTDNLALFEKTLVNFRPSVKKRKRSAINQFLKYLYEQKKVSHFWQIKESADVVEEAPQKPELIDLNHFYDQVQTPGQFIALLILEFGLTPSEIQHLKWSDFNFNFRVLTIERAGMKRVLTIPDRFTMRVRHITNADELFSKSRQFLHLELKKYTPYTAKQLREQYILRRVNEGKSIYEVAGLLGLRTITTLEKYYKP